MNHNETRGTVIEVVDIKSGGQSSNTFKKNVDATFNVGGIFSDFELAWLYHGSFLKVVSTSDGSVQSSWDFSTITRDNRTEITSVIEYEISEHGHRGNPKETQLCLIVAYTSFKDVNKASYISFCHPRTSKMLHTITTKEKITCMSLITSKKDHSCPISGIVKLMSGALALGTENGNLLIMDIKGYNVIHEVYSCTRKNNLFDYMQNRFSCTLILDMKQCSENEIKKEICKVDDDNYHVVVSIPVSDRKDSRDHDQSISSLMYIPQGLTLAVGLRSGVFQLWDISTLKKLYKSSSLMVPTPVVKFGFQEPCNDPQNFCYLWVLHESNGSEDTCLPFAVMYGILYKKLVDGSDYGRYYKSFVHCKKRFDMDVDMEGSRNGRCIACNVVSNTPSNMLRHITTNEVKNRRYGISEEDPSKINLFVMVFETWETRSNLGSHISLVVFDMNQWYKAQMPHQCYHGYSVPFVNVVLLDRVSDRKLSILDMRIKKDTIQQFLTFNLSEEYSYPSSLSFDTLFLTNSKFIHLRIPGVQRCIIEQIVAEGPNCLINPGKYFTECKETGLRPCFTDNYGHVIVPSQIQQRNYILTILLEHKMSNFLVRCVNEWADGSRAVSGCTLPNLIHWAWDCVTRIKQLTDTICVPLFDYSGDDLDRENYQKLKHCCQLLQLIRDLLMYIAKNFKHYLLEYKKLNQQIEILQLVTKYFKVIIWCLDVGLLPEKVTSSSDRCIPTYIASLMQYTEQRREELKILAMKDKYFLKEECTLYIIDSILQNETGGQILRQQWERESCGMTNGYYPPVTLQSLLRMFLMPNLSTDMKHFIMMYFLLDVCDYHRDDDMKEQLLSFSIVFFSNTKFLSLVEACWLIDHEKFEEASDVLHSDAVINYLKENKNLYDTMLKSCVCQGQYALALKCERIIKSSISLKNESFHITLLLLNGLIMEAYSTLRKNVVGDKKLLHNFFRVCDELGYLKEIFKFPLMPEEEVEFLTYLDGCTTKDSGDLKILYLLSRGRYVEAIDINHMMSTKVPKFGIIGNNTTKQDNNGRTTTRDLLVNAFSKTLPSVTNDLINLCRKERDKIYRHKHVTKPTPLSVTVHVDADKEIPLYKSSIESVMQAAICKTAETWSNFPRIDKNNKNVSFTQNTPFLRSQIMTPKRKQGDVSFSGLIRDKESKEKKRDPDEPPAKRIRRSLDLTSNSICDGNEDETLQSAPLDVTRILLTPHIQKRLNKLLESTPESSPLTSILKSSEASRFKQPQKVGFSVPEVYKRTPQRKMVDSSSNISTPLTEDVNVEELRVKKSLVKDFERSQQIQTEEVKIRNENVSESSENSSAVESYKSGENDDSYYSLESVNESENMMSFILDDSKVKEDVANKPSRFFIECMSDEDIECVTPLERTITEETPLNAEFQAPDIPQVVETAPPVEYEPMETVPLQYDNLVPIQDQTYSENVEIRNESNAAVGVITSTFSHFGQEFYQTENVNYTYETQPYEIDVEKGNEEVERLDEDRSSNIDNVSDYSQEYESENDRKEISSEPEASDEEDKSEGEEDELATTEKASSITEITESSEEDSDIEIIEDNTTPVIQTSHVLKSDESTRKTEDDNDEQLSEKTYESEYTYSDESLAEESEIEEQSVADEEDNVYVEDSNDGEEYEDDVEHEGEAIEEKVNDQYEHQSFHQDSTQIDYEALKNIVSTLAAADNNTNEEAERNAEIENIQIINETYTMKRENASIDNSTVDESMVVNESVNESAVENPSMSVCEVFDTTQSIIEETVHMSEANLNTTQNESVQVINETINEPIDLNYSIVNVTSITDSKIEDKTQNANDTGTSLVFYFGENSVNSIGDDVLKEERDVSINSQKSANVSDNKCVNVDPVQTKDTASTSKPAGDQPMNVDVAKCEEYSSVEKPQRYSVIEKSMEEAAAVKYSSVKEHDFLRTSVPECNVHIIEKVRNEMYSSDDGYDDSDVQPEQGSDEHHEINIVQEPRIITLEDEEKQITSVPADNLPIADEADDIMSPNSAASNQTCVTAIGADERSQHISSLISEKDITVDVSIVRVSQSPQALISGDDLSVETIEKANVVVNLQNNEQFAEIDICERNETPLRKDDEIFIESDAGSFKYESPIVAVKRTEHSHPLPERSDDVPVELPTSEELPQQQPFQVEPTPVVEISPGPKQQAESDALEITDSEPPTPRRRSMRIAKRRSIDCIPTAVQENIDMDDVMSIKSGSSVADSVVSRVSVASGSSTQSNRSQRKKSFSRLELRKSANTHNFKQLEVIMSDEEMTSPQKIEVGDAPTKTFHPKYAASEPGNTHTPTKRKRSTRSEQDVSDDDRMSSVSESGGRKQTHKRNVRRKSDLIQFDDAEITPLKPMENRRLGKFISSTPLVMSKLKSQPGSQVSAEVEEYTSSRRLTRSQKLYMEYGLSNRESNYANRNLPSTSGIRCAPITERLEEIEENEPDFSLSIDEDSDKMNSPKPSPQKLVKPPIKPISASRHTPTKKDQPSLPTRFSRRLSGRFEPPGNDDSLSSEEPPSPAKSVSSTSSRASTASRRSQRGRRSYTSMELRKSSVRPNFKPLAVIPSDDESQSFQQPTPTKHMTDESLLSSPSSTVSKASTGRKSRRQNTSRMTSDISDKEESSVSDVSSVSTRSTNSRKRATSSKSETKKSKVKVTEESETDQPSSVTTYTSNRRMTRTQKSKMEQTLKETSRKKKK